MFSEDKVTEIFCLADEFCKSFDAQQEKSMLEVPQDGKRHRRKPNRMSDAEIIVILIYFHSGGFRCFKHYYLHYICKHCRHLFPRTVSYNRFVELGKEVLLQLTALIKQVLLGECTGISFVDSTPLRVCRNQRILMHKTFDGLILHERSFIYQRGLIYFSTRAHLFINERSLILLHPSFRLQTLLHLQINA